MRLVDMLREGRILARAVGLGRVLRSKRRHQQAKPILRGYHTYKAIQALSEIGFLDELKKGEPLSSEGFASSRNMNQDVLKAVCRYLEGVGVLMRLDRGYALSEFGFEITEEPRGMFNLTRAYTPLVDNLTELIRGNNDGLERDIGYVARGSGELGEQIPFPVLRDIVLERGSKKVLDLGCGDMRFPIMLCRADGNVVVYGIDKDENALREAERNIRNADLDGRLFTTQADMFDLDKLKKRFEKGQIDCLVAIDVFHEYMNNPNAVIGLLRDYRNYFHPADFVIGEMFSQPKRELARMPSATLEHIFHHEISGQQVVPLENWRYVYCAAGFTTLDEKVFTSFGHCYHVLQ